MDLYIASQPHSPFEGIQAAIPAPPGADVSDQVKGFIQEVTAKLPRFGLVTPWAERQGDLAWRALASPGRPAREHYELFRMSDQILAAIFQEYFQLELPYLAVMTRSISPMSELERVFERTAYEPVRVDGVYSEGDKRTVPAVFYVTWLQRRRASLGKVTGLSGALAALGATLLLAQRVPANRAERRVPDISFDDARKLQVAGRAIR